MDLSRLASTKILLALICALFIFTRFYKITEVPVSVYWDEASIGYNAYAISTDLRDEWGKFLPIHFRAFGEFKLPVYIYSVVPFVKLFGLNAFTVRLPSVLYSLGVIILIFFLAKKLTSNSAIGIWSSFFMTISPWFFIFSRTGYEATAGLMFYLLAILLFFNLKKGNRFFLFSIIGFILSAYSYNSFRIISPLTVVILFLFESSNLSQLLKSGKIYLLVSLLIVILSIIPIYRLYAYDAGGARFQAIGGISNNQIVKNYFSHFNPHFLFIQGDTNLRSQQTGFGQLYWPDLILIGAALVYLLKEKSTKYKWLPLILLLFGPIPAAITKESPHALRSLSSVPFYAILFAQGAWYLKSFFRTKYLMEGLVVVIYLVFFIHYFINFLTIFPQTSANDWQDVYKKIFIGSMDKLDHNGKILISDQAGQPYIFGLFYLQYDPVKFRQQVIRNSVDKWGASTVKSFGNFEF